MKLIDKSALVAEIERQISAIDNCPKITNTQISVLEGDKVILTKLLSFINTLEVKDPYEQCIQYASIESGIKAHAEDYSFNIESELFNQLTKEQQTLWRKEIEQACISGGDAGVGLARDPRYKENLEVKEVDLEKEVIDWWNTHYSLKTYTFEGYAGHYIENSTLIEIAKHFFELGISVSSTKVTTQDLDDVLKENGVNPDSKEAKVFKESYYMALEKLKAQKGK